MGPKAALDADNRVISKQVFEKYGFKEQVDWTGCEQGPVEGFLNTVMDLDFHNYRVFLDLVSNYHRFKESA
jgi:hypothetical protein